jgi:NAD+ diphosphatase
MKSPNFYAGIGIDRGSERRRDDTYLSIRLTATTTRFIPVWRQRNLVLQGPQPAPVYLAAAALEEYAGERVYLGTVADTSYFAVRLSDHDEAALTALASHGQFSDLRAVGASMERRDGGLLAYARGLIHWHDRHRFCGVCGAPTQAESAGHVRKCTNPDCGAEHFPRTDPAVIMLVIDGDRCLLAWSRRWDVPFFSTLAGFVEPGESLEDAVIREVKEETGIDSDNVQYHSSQPWPFPASIMLGFYAQARSTAITVDPDEIREARWFTRAQLSTQHDPAQFRLPRVDSIARRLIDDWIAAG